MNDKYILDDKTPVPAPDLMAWAKWFESADRTVRRDVENEIVVSTVFLGLDHSFGGRPPLLFETMVFGGPLDGEMDRCSTWQQAEIMHDKMLGRVRTETPEIFT